MITALTFKGAMWARYLLVFFFILDHKYGLQIMIASMLAFFTKEVISDNNGNLWRTFTAT